jgi:hypothetical protein
VSVGVSGCRDKHKDGAGLWRTSCVTGLARGDRDISIGLPISIEEGICKAVGGGEVALARNRSYRRCCERRGWGLRGARAGIDNSQTTGGGEGLCTSESARGDGRRSGVAPRSGSSIESRWVLAVLSRCSVVSGRDLFADMVPRG